MIEVFGRVVNRYVSIAAILCFVGMTSAVWAWWRARVHCRELTATLREAHEQQIRDQDTLSRRDELDRIKDEFISTVSHELRTPLTSIRGALGLLSAGVAGQVDAKAQNLIRIASTNTDRLVRLINDMLDLQRMDSGKLPLAMSACSLPELVSQAADTMRSMADAAGVQIGMAQGTEASAPMMFEGDEDRIQQVLCNLLSNAIKFSPSGSTVTMSILSETASLLLLVEDRGRGVPADKLEGIFDRFRQVEAADSHRMGGTGLGLAICRSILLQHRGAIWAERNDGDGSGKPGLTVFVRLPRVQGSQEREEESARTTTKAVEPRPERVMERHAQVA